MGAVMRPLTVSLLVACLLAATAGPAMARSPSASPEPEGQRVEVPEHGFAVTFPSDWTVWEGLEEWPTTKGRRIYTGRIPMFRELLYADSPIRDTWSEQCEVQSFAYPGLTPFDIAYSLSVMSCGPSWSMPAHVSLPAGEAAQLHCQRTYQDGHTFYQSWYVLAADPGYMWLWCRVPDYRPDDRWLSIAESFEFLPAEE